MRNCLPSDVPPADAIDVSAIRVRYRLERDRRLRPEGQRQYLPPSGGTVHELYDHDPYVPVVPRAPVVEDLEVVVLGGGWSGLLAGVELRRAGVPDIRIVEHAGDFGGVWYWNRYPGVQCDNDAYCYLPMLEEMDFLPSKKFADGAEIRAYMGRIADRYRLRDDALFHTRVIALDWDESPRRWQISTHRGDTLRARHVVLANGLLNIPKLPGIAGIRDFAGHHFHTARWDYAYTGGSETLPELSGLADRRVAIIGTGATAIQAVPHLARHAKQLYVVQRTPSVVDARPNPPTDPAWVSRLAPGWQAERKANFHRGAIEGFRPDEDDLVCDFWTEINRNLRDELEHAGAPPASIAAYLERREVMDHRVMARFRARVDALVDDPATAESLKAWYRFSCKRPLSSNDYYPSFNRDNVTLLDVSGTQGLERVTREGIVVGGQEYPVDCLIFASGFEVTSDLDRRWGIAAIRGCDGLSLYEHWAGGYQTLHGMTTRGFPNLYFMGFYQGGFNATTTETFRAQAHHIAWLIDSARRQGVDRLEPTVQAQADWVRHIRETGIDVTELQRECTPSYFNNEGQPDIGKDGRAQFRWYIGEAYGPGWDAFLTLLQGWREAGDFAGFQTDHDIAGPGI